MRHQASDRLRNVLIPVLSTIVVVGLVLPPSAFAQWRVEPSIGAGFEYDDNPSLNTGAASGSSVNGYLVEADAAFIYDSPLTDFSVTPSVLIRRYDKSSNLDSDDFFLDLNYSYTGERSQFRVRGVYGDESARTAERAGVDLEIEDPDEIPDDESGRVLGTEKRQRVHLSPEWSYQTGPKSRVHIGANFIDVSYDDRLTSLYTGYDEIRGIAGMEYNWSERSAITIDGYYKESYFDALDRDFSGFGATAGVDNSLSEQTRLIMNIGIDSTEDSRGDKETNPIGEISLIRNMETSRMFASYRRTVSGSGLGAISVRDSVALNFTRDISEKFSVGGGVRAYKTSALASDDPAFNEQDYLQFRTSLSWNLTRAWSIDLDYIYTNIDRESLASDADSNVVNLWFRYYRQRQ
jgi:hypothetical protein